MRNGNKEQKVKKRRQHVKKKEQAVRTWLLSRSIYAEDNLLECVMHWEVTRLELEKAKTWQIDIQAVTSLSNRSILDIEYECIYSTTMMKEFVQLPLISVSLQYEMIQFCPCSGIKNFLCSLLPLSYIILLWFFFFGLQLSLRWGRFSGSLAIKLNLFQYFVGKIICNAAAQKAH